MTGIGRQPGRLATPQSHDEAMLVRRFGPFVCLDAGLLGDRNALRRCCPMHHLAVAGAGGVANGDQMHEPAQLAEQRGVGHGDGESASVPGHSL